MKIGNKAMLNLLRLVIKILSKIVGLYGKTFNFDAFRTECKRVKGSKQAELKEICACLKTLEALENKKIAGIGDIKNKMLLKFWKQVISKFPGLCKILKGEAEAKKLLKKAQADLKKLKAFNQRKDVKAAKQALKLAAMFWVAYLLGKELGDQAAKKFLKELERQDQVMFYDVEFGEDQSWDLGEDQYEVRIGQDLAKLASILAEKGYKKQADRVISIT